VFESHSTRKYEEITQVFQKILPKLDPHYKTVK